MLLRGIVGGALLGLGSEIPRQRELKRQREGERLRAAWAARQQQMAEEDHANKLRRDAKAEARGDITWKQGQTKFRQGQQDYEDKKRRDAKAEARGDITWKQGQTKFRQGQQDYEDKKEDDAVKHARDEQRFEWEKKNQAAKELKEQLRKAGVTGKFSTKELEGQVNLIKAIGGGRRVAAGSQIEVAVCLGATCPGTPEGRPATAILRGFVVRLHAGREGIP